MGPDEARRVLGVGRDASPADVRAAYRRLVRSHHPDVAGTSSTDRAVRVIAAYQVLTQPTTAGRSTSAAPSRTSRSRRPAPPPPPPGPPPAPSPQVGHDAIPLAGPTLDVFNLLCEAADVLGDVSHVDVAGGLLETIVTWDGWPPCSLLITLLQRGDQTLAQCTLESLTGPPGPPIESVVRELHRILAALAE
jgi:hypothetical protein